MAVCITDSNTSNNRTIRLPAESLLHHNLDIASLCDLSPIFLKGKTALCKLFCRRITSPRSHIHRVSATTTCNGKHPCGCHTVIIFLEYQYQSLNMARVGDAIGYFRPSMKLSPKGNLSCFGQ